MGGVHVCQGRVGQREAIVLKLADVFEVAGICR
jgi:hypothetical protein